LNLPVGEFGVVCAGSAYTVFMNYHCQYYYYHRKHSDYSEAIAQMLRITCARVSASPGISIQKQTSPLLYIYDNFIII